jgi:hypothetical protein
MRVISPLTACRRPRYKKRKCRQSRTAPRRGTGITTSSVLRDGLEPPLPAVEASIASGVGPYTTACARGEHDVRYPCQRRMVAFTVYEFVLRDKSSRTVGESPLITSASSTMGRLLCNPRSECQRLPVASKVGDYHPKLEATRAKSTAGRATVHLPPLIQNQSRGYPA